MASLLDRLQKGLTRTRAVLEMPVEDLLRGRRPLDPGDLERIEEALIAADLGVSAAAEAVAVLKERSGEIAGGGAEAMRFILRDELRRQLDRPLAVRPFSSLPWVVLVVGVNGTKASHDIALNDGDEVTIVGPMTGGAH